MPMKPDNGNQRKEHHGAQDMPSSTFYSQPWWRGFGNSDGCSPASLTESAMKSSSEQQEPIPAGFIQAEANGGLNNGGSDENSGQEKDHFKHVPSSLPGGPGEHHEPNSQMELVGHSIVLTSYPYSDPHYGGIMTPYGPQPMVHPHLYGLHHTRMPLPLELEEEPVYVNAKQYHGILRRRQSRAKAELEKKAVKERKPYLHESRHKHAMKRARGCGGRFLNTKKLDGDTANLTSEKGMNGGPTNSTQAANSAGSKHLQTDSIRNLNQSIDQQEGSRVQDKHEGQSFANKNSNTHGLSSIYQLAGGNEEGSCFSQQRGRMHANRAPQRIHPIK